MTRPNDPAKRGPDSDTSIEIQLDDLTSNDYNPRENAGSNIDSLKESIKEEGLIQALTVRPVDDGYEVISGERRLHALRELYDSDYSVPATVHDVGDEQARRMALAENIEREDLTPIEEAWGFAEGVTVDSSNVAGDEPLSYAEYVRNLGRHVVPDGVYVPSRKHSDVVDWANSIDYSGDYVHERLSFLTLPKSIREQIAAGDFPKRAARKLARVSIDDIDARADAIENIASRFSGGLDNDDYDKLDRLIEAREQQYQERQELKLEELEQKQQVVANREDDMLAELTDAAEFAREEFSETFSFGQIDESTAKDDIGEMYDEVKGQLTAQKSELDETANAAGQKVDDLNSRAAKLEQAIDILREEERVDTDGDWWADLHQTLTGLNDGVEEHEEDQSTALKQHREVRDTLDALSHQYRELERARNDLAELKAEVETDE